MTNTDEFEDDDDDPERFREEAAAALAEVERICLAYVGEHYVPWDESRPSDEFEGSDSDPEAVWDRALDEALGPWEMWETLDGIEDNEECLQRCIGAYFEVIRIGLFDLARMQHEARLFGDEHVELREFHSPEGTAVWTITECMPSEDTAPKSLAGFRGVVSTYMANVRGGLIDATSAFHEFEDDDEEGA